MSSGTITLRRPRVRGVEERFESRVLPLFARRTKELGALLPQLYLHGLAEGDFELAMRGLLGEGAPLSKSSIRRLRAGWTAEFEEWSQRRLEGREVVYVWADGIYVKAGLERDKAALLVVLGAMRDGTVSTPVEKVTNVAGENVTLGGGDEPLVRRFLLCSCSLSLRG